MDTIVKKLMENRLHEEFDPTFDEDLKKYKGKPIKELLKDLNGKVRVKIDCARPDVYGISGYSGTANGVTWSYADMIIKAIGASDGKYVDVFIKC